ncbi:hypothetical protein D6856_01560 [Butyrivibrio sp. XB500-5]|uniref:hypothetical protein n=1 Tax=Butyrivibrio sp. XB500-5 TaxID=2364880 RepID=UPI000EAA763C|nr:hypothetical protein [Butyrivibrio sp. XB500-5]RKM62838.1 hypothetical protein D6856_01560 [Butyrivibrio sp. XB500-5]
MKKVFKMVVSTAMCAILLCACGYSASTQSSPTGKISTKIENNKVTLNHTEYEFPEGYKFEDLALSNPVGISRVKVTDSDGQIVGICSDGMYTENITKENMIDAANTVFMEVHNIDTPLNLSEDMFVDGKNVEVLVISLDDGTAVFVGQLGTPNFAYITMGNADSESVMQGYVEQAILKLGGQEDYDTICG